MSKKLYLSTIISIIFLVGCTTRGPQFNGLQPIINEQGLLYIYVPSHSGLNANYEILIDNIAKGNIKNKNYRYFQLDPGRHWIAIKGVNTIDLYVTLKPRSYNFIRLMGQDGSKELSGIVPTPFLNIPIIRRQKLISVQLTKKQFALRELKDLNYLQQPTER